jgi:type VII secretion protein EccE
MTAAQAPPQPESTRPESTRLPASSSTPPASERPRLRSGGARLGPLPIVNLVVLEIGLALGLALIAFDTRLWWAAVFLALVALPLAFGRWQGHWLVHWLRLATRYLLRSRTRTIPSPDPAATADHQRLAALRLFLPDLAVAPGADRQREPVGFAWHQDGWTAVLEVDDTSSMVIPVGGTANLPLGALASCLQDRGMVLDGIQVIWHCYPGSTALPSSSPALRSYLEVLGPLPAAARRTTWIAVRLDPRRCPEAIAERGGGVTGCHRALVGALSRVRATLESRGTLTRLLDADHLLHAAIYAAELSGVAGSWQPIVLSEGWTAVTAAGVGHASYAITGWGPAGAVRNLGALTGIRALSTTVALSISPGEEGCGIGLRGLVRLSARNPAELEAADGRLRAVSQRLGVTLSPLGGLHISGLAATLPLGAFG